MEHVKDEVGQWTIFTEMFGGWRVPLGPPVNVFGLHFQFTKFMLLEVIAAGLIVAIYVPLARRAARSTVPRGPVECHGGAAHLHPRRGGQAQSGRADHADRHAASGNHGHAAPAVNPADKYVPFLWTLFLFVLFCNLLGMIPLMGSPTANIWVTGALALCSFVMMHGVAIAKMGPLGYVKSLWPKIEIPLAIGIFLKPAIFGIEVVGTVIKSGVLAVRLFANMFAGHMVLATILFFIVATANSALALWAGVTVASVVGVVALSLLELFVAFLQAYIFTFLTA